MAGEGYHFGGIVGRDCCAQYIPSFHLPCALFLLCPPVCLCASPFMVTHRDKRVRHRALRSPERRTQFSSLCVTPSLKTLRSACGRASVACTRTYLALEAHRMVVALYTLSRWLPAHPQSVTALHTLIRPASERLWLDQDTNRIALVVLQGTDAVFDVFEGDDARNRFAQIQAPVRE